MDFQKVIEIETQKIRDDKVLQMAWQLYCAIGFNIHTDSREEMKKCIEKAKQFIKIYEEQNK